MSMRDMLWLLLPLAVLIYFVIYPNDFDRLIAWMTH
jgi:hypothetical protein